jgi:hypothetical protein
MAAISILYRNEVWGGSMKRSVYFVVPLLVLAALAAACDGNGGGEQPEAGVTAEATSSPGTAVTPAEEVTPGATSTFTPSAGVSPIPGARLATLSENVAAYLSQFGDDIPTAVICGSYDADTGLVDCKGEGRGTFQLDPPVPAEVKECRVGILEDKVVYVSCIAELAAYIYEIGE